MISLFGFVVSIILSYIAGFFIGKRIKIKTLKRCANCGSIKKI